MAEWPTELRANAWTGDQSPAGILLEDSSWGLKKVAASQTGHLAPPNVEDRDWTQEEVGWGIVLPDREGIDDKGLSQADDAPEQVQRLIRARKAVVLRYRPDLGIRFLRRHYENRSAQDLSISDSPQGAGEGQLPLYVMIFASPMEIPWSLQFALNLSRCVGRLDPSGSGWENYVEALIANWGGCHCDTSAPVIWSVDHGGSDITRLMAAVVAEKLWECFEADTDASRRVRLKDQDATGTKLASTLGASRPAFIVTTSHGMTGPLDNRDELLRRLGVPVDVEYSAVEPGVVLGDWEPNGAIWYSHACCSAGSDAPSRFGGLFDEGDALRTLLGDVADLAGACVSPLAHALLGASRPARAFVGHVEPTFDWTLRDPRNRQVISNAIVKGLYKNLFRVKRGEPPTPIGYALADVYKQAGSSFGAWNTAYDEVNKGIDGAERNALYAKLVALDRQNIVILGDPAASLPLKTS